MTFIPVLGKERNTASRLVVNRPPHKRLGLLPLRLVDHDITEHILRNQEAGIESNREKEKERGATFGLGFD